MLRYLFPGLFLAAIAVAGCGGSPGSTPLTLPATTPSPGPSAPIPVGPSPASVTLSADGYTLTFVVPPVVTGTTATMTAALSTAPPAGIPTPYASQRTTSSRKPAVIGSPVTTLIYLTVSSTGQVGFASAPSFIFTLPSNVTIPSGATTSLFFYDPNVGPTAWVPLLSPGTVSGQTVTFPSVQTGFNILANTPYVFALGYTSQPVVTPSPAPTPSASPAPTASASPVPGTVALTLTNKNSNMPSSGINIYIAGQVNGSNPAQWVYVTANGGTVPMTNNGANIPPIPFGGGSTSNTIYLPPLTSARVYIVEGTFKFNIPTTAPAAAGPNNPAPWASDASTNEYFDYVEYTFAGGSFNADTSQVDSFNLPLGVTVNGTTSGTFGFTAGAVTALHGLLKNDSAQWQTLNSQWPYRVMNPGHGDQSGFFSNTSFLDTPLQTAWDAYKTQTMALNLAPANAAWGTIYGQVDTNENFQFYATPALTGTPVVTILSPFSSTNQQTYKWGTATMQVLANSGAFSYVANTSQIASEVLAAGNRVVGALNRGTFGTNAQVSCPNPTGPYTVTGYQNDYASYLHQVALETSPTTGVTYGYNGGAYGFSYDDSCGSSTDTTVSNPTTMSVTIYQQ